MELFSEDGDTCVFIVTGNSRLGILNAFSEDVLDKQYIKVNDNVMKITAFNTRRYKIPQKCYLSLSFCQKIFIDAVYDYNEYVTQRVIPIYDIKQHVCKLLGITIPITIDDFEIQRNEKMLDVEYDNIFTPDDYKTINNIHVHGNQNNAHIISKYGNYMKLSCLNNSLNVSLNNINESDADDADIDDDEPDDNKVTDIFVFDELR
jgi:hypothetical protein